MYDILAYHLQYVDMHLKTILAVSFTCDSTIEVFLYSSLLCLYASSCCFKDPLREY